MRHSKCGILGWICLVLTIIGGINWGLVGIFSFNLIAALFSQWPLVERIIYVLVGISAIILIFLACRWCGKGSCKTKQIHTHVPPSNKTIPPV
ncbi:MAG: DUF378 domain-containing protein [Proteobacteria bacterium]|nr:DUF378 domain-containing protein [Pseudomonadota bacterium]